ncbi:MAG: RluA family pseudouridine synthase [Pseudomonadota bacterium]
MHILIEQSGRVDRAIVAAAPQLSRTRVQALIRAGAVELNGAPLENPALHVNPGDEVRLQEPAPKSATPKPEAIPLDVIYEDEHLIVIHKPAGLVVHPGAGHRSGTLVNALLYHCGDSLSGIGGVTRPGIVHRLDKDTSGVMVAAKNDRAHQSLAAQFADHGRTGSLDRLYDAIIWGTLHPPAGTVNKPIGRHPSDRQRFAVRTGGKSAITHFQTREDLGVASLVSCRLETGRTHQIRVHMSAIGTPLVGDPLYAAGFATKLNRLGEPARAAVVALGRQALHAGRLTFTHPVDGAVRKFTVAPPADFLAVQNALRADGKAPPD